MSYVHRASTINLPAHVSPPNIRPNFLTFYRARSSDFPANQTNDHLDDPRPL